MSSQGMIVRALLLGEALDLKGLEREDAFSVNPLGFRTSANGSAMLFKFGAVVFFNMTPIEEEGLIHGLEQRILGPLSEREIETAVIVTAPDDEDLLSKTGAIQVKSTDSNRLLLVGEALAVSVALAYDERRIAAAFDKIEPLAATLIRRRLPPGPKSAMLEQIGEALLIQKRLASRVDLDEKPDVLWDHPELERLWAKLVDEYDLAARGRAVERKLAVIRETADTITDLISTRTSHRLELLVIVLIAIEIVLALAGWIFK
ncbi:MAG: RMD1 family protein [Rhodomicrobium sp.]